MTAFSEKNKYCDECKFLLYDHFANSNNITMDPTKQLKNAFALKFCFNLKSDHYMHILLGAHPICNEFEEYEEIYK